jgi:hypothetical protein
MSQITVARDASKGAELKKAVKHDAEKPALHLLPPAPLVDIAQVFGYGEKKYAAWNYIDHGGLDASRIYRAALGHLMAWYQGEDTDPESGHAHLAHAGCSVLMLMQILKSHPARDNRPEALRATAVPDAT